MSVLYRMEIHTLKQVLKVYLLRLLIQLICPASEHGQKYLSSLVGTDTECLFQCECPSQ